MNLFCTSTTPLSERDLARGKALTDVATIGLLQERSVRQKEVLAEQLQGADHPHRAGQGRPRRTRSVEHDRGHHRDALPRPQPRSANERDRHRGHRRNPGQRSPPEQVRLSDPSRVDVWRRTGGDDPGHSLTTTGRHLGWAFVLRADRFGPCPPGRVIVLATLALSGLRGRIRQRCRERRASGGGGCPAPCRNRGG